MIQLIGCCQSCRTCANDCHTLAVTHWCDYVHVVFLEGVLGDGRLVLTVCCRLVLGKVQYACLLAECRADASRELRERAGGIEQLVSEFPVAFV